MEEITYCLGCMHPLDWDGKCRRCGFEPEKYRSSGQQLPLGSTLHRGEYLIGRVLGEGGFGITYIGLNRTLLIPVAIKEYFPNGVVWRNVKGKGGDCNVTPVNEEAEQMLEQGKNDFLKEARILSQFGSLEGIVRTRSFFEENHTAYLVMDYIDGSSVKNYIAQNGKLTPEACWSIMKYPIRALQQLHTKNLVHQDVSPDNILINAQGKGVLIDFGAVRYANAIDDKSRTAVYKQGFSAYEQLEKRGKRGPWTDVYGVCATIYYMLSGVRPLDATERVFTDDLVPLSQYCPQIAPAIEACIHQGMIVEVAGRLQTLDALYQAIYSESDVMYHLSDRESVGGKQAKEKKQFVSHALTRNMEKRLKQLAGERKHRRRLQLTGYMLCIICVLAVGISTGNRWLHQQKKAGENSAILRGTDTPVPKTGQDASEDKTAHPADSTTDVTAAKAEATEDAKNVVLQKKKETGRKSKTGKKSAVTREKTMNRKGKNGAGNVSVTKQPVRRDTKASNKTSGSASQTRAPKQKTNQKSTSIPKRTSKPKKTTVNMDGDMDELTE